jgi:hypothetical protein
VWSGSDLQVSPTAGLFGQSNALTSGILEMGKLRYLNLQECLYQNVDARQFARVVNTPGAPNFTSTSNASNTSGAPGDCGPAGVFGFTLLQDNEQSFDLLGNRYLNLQECLYQNSVNGRQFARVVETPGAPNFTSTSNASNTSGAPGDCGPAGVFDQTLIQQHEQSFDLLGNRYLNLQECLYQHDDLRNVTRVIETPGNPNFTSTSNASNTSGAPGDCGPAGVFGYSLNQVNEQSFDLLDPARGRGYVEYSVTAPPAPTPEACASNPSATTEEFDQDSSLTSTPSGVQAAAGTITVDWSALDEPCPTDPIPLGDPLVLAGGLGALAGAAYVLHRRRMAIAA